MAMMQQMMNDPSAMESPEVMEMMQQMMNDPSMAPKRAGKVTEAFYA